MELKPCMFCKEEADVVTYYTQPFYPQGTFVICNGCGARGPIKGSALLAIEAWNRRA